MPRYRSQIRQSLHYFARPQARILRESLDVPARWRGEALADDPSWREPLGEAAIREIEAALRHVRKTARPDAALRKEDFPLPSLARRFRAWRQTLAQGRGFQVISGVPVARWSPADVETFFWCFGLHLGLPGAQNPQGDLVGHVRDTGAPSDGSVRQYRSAENIGYHCDLADVVGLLCLRPAARGGLSRIASSVYAYQALLERRPELVERLYAPFLLDTKGEGGVPWIPVVPCAFADGTLRTFWHIGYFRSVARHPDALPLDSAAAEVLDFYDTVMNAPGVALEMELRPGDIQLLSNHSIVHGRTRFEDGENPQQRRHLLRLWLSLPERRGLRSRMLTERSRLGVLAALLRGRAAARFPRLLGPPGVR